MQIKKSLDSAAEEEFSVETLATTEQILSMNYQHADMSVDIMQEVYRLNKLTLASAIDQGKCNTETQNNNVLEDFPPPKELNKANMSAAWIVEKEVGGLASFPDIYYKINEVLNSPPEAQLPIWLTWWKRTQACQQNC